MALHMSDKMQSVSLKMWKEVLKSTNTYAQSFHFRQLWSSEIRNIQNTHKEIVFALIYNSNILLNKVTFTLKLKQRY